ncbi:N-acetyltransferase [Altericroceibacterium spongiae]|uniref:N-acetyltransferase n=1 Tax=Altericroceibacterium spongiae TaxID=2320269 RepID=A0A420EEY5_9SPHN|nr:GNAT family N-acetyltransferase [Altericroceibacterium spongiae]RKF19228.1 N-acetyltransferase [Altericroceibacterium spongiae]
MSRSAFSSRLAEMKDLPRLSSLMALSIENLQRGFLNDAQIAASRAVMGLDTQLVQDGTYFIVEEGEHLAGCGGWSRRATLYGGDHSAALRDPAMLDPASDAARVRAMYTHPDFARRGVGRLILDLCEEAAMAEGFTRAEMMATMSGQPLYEACGYREIEKVEHEVDGVTVPLLRMGKNLTSTLNPTRTGHRDPVHRF